MKTPAILSRLFRPATKGLADPWPEIFQIFGVTQSETGVTISAAQALTIPAVKSAMQLIAEAAASLWIGVKEVAADGTETDAKDHPVNLILRGPANGWTSGFELIRDLVIDALSDDRGGVAWVNRLSDGSVFEVLRYRSGVVMVDLASEVGEPVFKIGSKPVAREDMIWLRGPFGRSSLTLAREAIAVGYLLGDHAAKLFNNGARPSGALIFPKGMSEETVKKARAAWRETHEGGGSGKTAILYDGADFKPLAFSSTDAQFLENREFQITEIARAFRVPPSMLFQLDRATWGNTEQMGREFLTYCLEPWLRALEGAFNRALFSDAERGRFVVRFDRDDLSRADLATRASTVSTLVSAEVINRDEGRDWFGLGPRPNGEGEAFGNPHINVSPAPDPDKPGADDASK